MYHEERIINGILCYRGDPNGKFEPYTAEQISQLYAELKSKNDTMYQELSNLKSNVVEALDTIKCELGDWVNIESPYAPSKIQVLKDIKDILE